MMDHREGVAGCKAPASRGVSHDNTAATSDNTPAARTTREYRCVLVLLLSAAALHTPSLFNPFFIDDYVYVDAAYDLDWAGIRNVFTTSTMNENASGVWWTPSGTLPLYRPIGEMTFAADQLLWGLNPVGYHLTNLMLHLACTFLTWRLARRLIEGPMMPLVVALVFALHPIHNEAVVWISGRFDLLVCFCVLASTLSYLNWQEDRPRAWLWGAFSVLWFATGLGCKETTLVLPVVLVGAELLRWRGRRAAYCLARLAAAVAAFGSISLLYVAGRFALFGGLGTIPPPYGLDLSTTGSAIGGVTWNLAQYLLDFALFIHVDAFYIARFWSNHLVLMGLALAASLLICAACTKLAWRLRAFRVGLLWVLLFTAPCLMAMPGERNVYLSSVGVALIAAAALSAWLRHGESAPGLRRWTRRVSFAVVSLWIVVGVAEHGVMWCLAATGEKVFRDLEASIPTPPPGARIYVVNQCPLNFVGFDQALRLRYGRSDLSGCALSLSPTLHASSVDRIVATSPASIRLVREGGFFFDSFIERFHLFSAPASTLPDACRRFGLTLLDPPSSYDQVTELAFRFPYPLDDPRVRIFTWNNERIQTYSDLAKLNTLTRLEPFEPVDTASAR